MRKRVDQTILASVLMLAAAHASAGDVTITFEGLAEGEMLSKQYAGIGVAFSPNALSGASDSSSAKPVWATGDTGMSITNILGKAATGHFDELGTPPLVSGNVLHSYGDWINEQTGDPNFRINFSNPVVFVSVDFASVFTPLDTRLFVYNNTGLLGIVAGPTDGSCASLNCQFTLSYGAEAITSVVVAPGSYDDWVAVDNIRFITQAVPEPETYATMGVGLALLGLLRRRG